jgi:hypothetical protein
VTQRKDRPAVVEGVGMCELRSSEELSQGHVSADGS